MIHLTFVWVLTRQLHIGLDFVLIQRPLITVNSLTKENCWHIGSVFWGRTCLTSCRRKLQHVAGHMCLSNFIAFYISISQYYNLISCFWIHSRETLKSTIHITVSAHARRPSPNLKGAWSRKPTPPIHSGAMHDYSAYMYKIKIMQDTEPNFPPTHGG